MQRNTLIDRLRGYACFLVLLGHVILGMLNAGVPMPECFRAFTTFLWSFHVALFLFLSGNVYRLTGTWRSKGTRGNFIAHKALNLGVPYVVFSVVYVLVNSFAGRTNTEFELADLFWIWKTPIAQYWYLYALFFLFAIWSCLSDKIGAWLLTACMVAIGYLVPAVGGSLEGFEIVFGGALVFGFGSAVDVEKLEKIPFPAKTVAILAHLVLGFVLVYFCVATEPGFKELLQVVGIFASVQLISLIQKWKPLAKCLDFLNRYSFQIYLLHTIFTAGVRIVLLRFGISAWPVHLFVGVAVGLGASVLVARVAKKMIVPDFAFFPSKTIRTLSHKKQG